MSDFVPFYFESNSTFGHVDDPAGWAARVSAFGRDVRDMLSAKLAPQAELDALPVDYYLGAAGVRSGKRLSFGFRREHTGTLTLGEWAKSHGMDLEAAVEARARLLERFDRVLLPYCTEDTLHDLYGFRITGPFGTLMNQMWLKDKRKGDPELRQEDRYLRWPWVVLLQHHKINTVKRAAVDWGMTEQSLETVLHACRGRYPRPLRLSEIDPDWGPYFLDARVLEDVERELTRGQHVLLPCCNDLDTLVLHARIREELGVQVEPLWDQEARKQGVYTYATVWDSIARQAFSNRRRVLWLNVHGWPNGAVPDMTSAATAREVGKDRLAPLLYEHDLYNLEFADEVRDDHDCGLYDSRLAPEANWARLARRRQSDSSAAPSPTDPAT